MQIDEMILEILYYCIESISQGMSMEESSRQNTHYQTIS